MEPEVEAEEELVEPVKASEEQYAFGEDFPRTQALILWPVGCTILFSCFCWELLIKPNEWTDRLWFLAVVALSGLLGIATGALFHRVINGFRYFQRAVANGAPFRQGDTVQVLSRSFRDRIVQVLEVYENGMVVRVDLGPDAKRRNDVFMGYQVLRRLPPLTGKNAEDRCRT